MNYDRKVRHALTTILGAGETTDEDIDRAIPPLTLKIEDGHFVKVEPFTRWLKVIEREETCYRTVEAPDA